MRLLRHNLAHLPFGANMVCTQMRLTEQGRHAKPGGRRSPRSPRHRRAVGGAHPHINACGRTLANQEMGAARAGVHTQGQHLRLPPGQDFELRHKTRADPVADAIGESRLLVQRGGPGMPGPPHGPWAPISAQAISSW